MIPIPVNKSLFDSLVEQYGESKAKKVYSGLEQTGSKGFKKGLATARKEKHTIAHLPKSKKKKAKK